MNEIKRDDEKPKEEEKKGGRSLYPGKRICTSADIVSPIFGRRSKGPNTRRIRPTHGQIAELAYKLWKDNGRQPDKEEEFWNQAETELCRQALENRKKEDFQL